MKVLFVSSGNNTKIGIAPFVYSQGESLKEHGIEIEYFPIRGKGIIGYLRARKDLNNLLQYDKFDLIHVHYVLVAWLVVMLRPKIPVILSLMGDDAYGSYVGPNKVRFISRYLTLLTLLIQPFVDHIICKSENIYRYIYMKKKASIIPNGVNLEMFAPIYEGESPVQKRNSISVLFLGDTNDTRKNYSLLYEAAKILNNDNLNLITPYPVKHSNLPSIINQCDIVCLCSFQEGSPNVVKEAMACDKPLICTDVGDVKWLFEGVDGCFIASFDPKDFANNLKKAIEYAEQKLNTNGRKRIMELGLDINTVAKRIVTVYQKVVENN